MEAGEKNTDTVHPEVRAHINSLVSALGGFSADDDGQYRLGDDALDVLRDIKKWIRFYDEKTNRMDVARCLAEANLVGGDLLPILATWPENAMDNRFKARVALACFEIMAPLTWPIEKNKEEMTVNHHRHMPVLQVAQLGYKRDIINFDNTQILRSAVRVALPSMAIPAGDRSPRDQGIIRLMLYFIRNIAMITPPPGIKFDGDESQISRSATIDAFSYQDILLTILTIASNMGEDFRTEDVVVMEIIFHLVKRVDIQKLFLNEQQLNKAKANELDAMMKKEAAMLRSYNRKAPTRHSRFGTMLWVDRGDGKMSSLSGQDVLADAAGRERKMDQTKTFKPPRRARKEGMEPKDLGPPVSLNARANDQLRGFVEEFLDSGFNPLFQHVRKTIARDAPHLMNYHRAQFFYLVAWFLEAERVRQKSKKGKKAPSQDDISTFNLVAGVLNQEMFATLMSGLYRSLNQKDWPELIAVMRCFTQILLTVQEMFESENEEDQEIAENILNRLFYEEATHDAVANIVRQYAEQGFEYLDACTELQHTYLRMLESYSKQNVDLQVRSRKRTRRKKKADKAAGLDNGEEEDPEDDDSANDEANAQQTSQERKFDFKRFASRFASQGCVDTFVKFTMFYKDLNETQLKRAHRYFYRVAFKQEMSVVLFRVDIIHLLYNIIKGPEPLDKSSSMYKEWEELVKQILRRCVRKIEERPALITEMLFSKINSTAHYLEFGYEKQTMTSSHAKPAAELEFRQIVDPAQQIAIAVGALLDRNETDHIDWVKKQLSVAESERRAWEAAEKAMPSVEGGGSDENAEGAEKPADEGQAKEMPVYTIHPDDNGRRTAMFKNAYLRLLMKLVGFERLAQTIDESPDSVWVIPANFSADQLKEFLDFINKAEFSPPTFDGGYDAAAQLRRKAAPRKKAEYDDDNDDADDGFLDDEMFFPPNSAAPSSKPADALAKLKKAARRRRKQASDSDGEDVEPLDEEEVEARRRARRQKELEKARKIKSELYVHASDDETDDERDREFFEREEAIRKRVKEALLDAPTEAAPKTKTKGKKQNKTIAALIGSDDEDLFDSTQDSTASKPKKRKSGLLDDTSDEEEVEDVELDSSSPKSSAAPAKRRKTTTAGFLDDDSDDEEEEAEMTQSSAGEEEQVDEDADKSDDEMDTEGTPPSSEPPLKTAEKAAQAKATTTTRSPLAEKALNTTADVEMDDDDMPLTAPVKARGRARAAFLVDSSDEE